MRKVKVEVENHSYPVLIGENLLSSAARELSGLPGGGKALVVTDETVAALYLERFLPSLEKEGWNCRVEAVAPGEKSKTLETVQELYHAAVEHGMDRGSPVIALGGGVVGDLAGFVAATYLRGVPFIQVPTTLLSQVDSSVGGKVGVNHPRGKNLIGAFYQPELVIIDPATLYTLNGRQFKAGMAEVLKYGIIADREFWGWLEENLDPVLDLSDSSLLEHAITVSVEAKARVVNRDEKEAGLRRILNLGHTFGHALESATGYEYYLHGEAVLVGIQMAAFLSFREGFLAEAEKNRISWMLNRVGIPAPPPGISVEEVWRRFSYDKKRQGESTVFILPTEIGRVQACSEVGQERVREVIEEYLQGSM